MLQPPPFVADYCRLPSIATIGYHQLTTTNCHGHRPRSPLSATDDCHCLPPFATVRCRLHYLPLSTLVGHNLPLPIATIYCHPLPIETQVNIVLVNYILLDEKTSQFDYLMTSSRRNKYRRKRRTTTHMLRLIFMLSIQTIFNEKLVHFI